MTWIEVNPRYVRQDDPALQASWFRDDRSVGGGELMMWVDRAGRLTAFQLSHEEWPGNREYLAHWRSGERLKFGTVDSGEGGPGAFKMSPTINFNRVPSAEALGELVTYFQTNATLVDEQHRSIILRLLQEIVTA